MSEDPLNDPAWLAKHGPESTRGAAGAPVISWWMNRTPLTDDDLREGIDAARRYLERSTPDMAVEAQRLIVALGEKWSRTEPVPSGPPPGCTCPGCASQNTTLLDAAIGVRARGLSCKTDLDRDDRRALDDLYRAVEQTAPDWYARLSTPTDFARLKKDVAPMPAQYIVPVISVRVVGRWRVYFNRHGAAPLLWCVAPDAGGWEIAVHSVSICAPASTVYTPKATPDDDDDGKPSAWIEASGMLVVDESGFARIEAAP